MKQRWSDLMIDLSTFRAVHPLFSTLVMIYFLFTLSVFGLSVLATISVIIQSGAK